ncbi:MULTISPECIES: uroporphyrinogen-III C-methyltransferase [Arthrobacter]|uniref:Uroporphyrinogen-III C-methyltransferase n=1 Tax=Arthrobacter psychrochitiniphilus TaxID=291045 RepID=A0A2V3DTB7_9MICC|nr:MULTISPECIES: uroporphyrinogen-III C-methyltransferase [Arthrobacter]NYG18827.1 uroporphyrin-III C-methyltransferase/precorrin-2 dehydrogenase/sirohydrochlorin ferrochelatase [Arthrobacter psychrochitiniphilus]PXA66260.1 uroporphyrinogen-III C-methyltransferase [Arthrobacter psychrochitiniphilus]
MAIVDLFPTSLRLLGRPVLVVGGGTVAARRAKALLDAGAQVTLVAPVLSVPAQELADAGLLRWHARGYESTDMTQAWYVVAATNNSAVDSRVALDAEANRTWCVNHSNAQESAAWTPAVATVEDIKVAVNAGGDPLRAVAIRNAISAALEIGELPLRRYRTAGQRGSVALVGGGPGAEDLITVRGRRLLAEADVVVADRLGPRGLLSTLSDDVKIIEVGKTPGHHPVTQSEINAILVREAQAGNRVVRLKGGDPYVLGRGGEEAIACRENGVDVQVVPGVTSAVSVPAAAGIPVTHRGLAKAFTMISGHEELENVPQGSDHTVVLLMGVGTLNRSIPLLEAAGRGPDCPVAIIENGYAKNQRVTIGTLGTIVALAQAGRVRNPAVVVVGDVVRVSPLAPIELATANYGTRETISSLS